MQNRKDWKAIGDPLDLGSDSEERSGIESATPQIRVRPAWIYENAARSPEFVSRCFNDRVAAYMSAGFLRKGLDANTVTTIGVLVHIATALIVFALPSESKLPAAIVVLLGWQLAFTLDCSDGQVARTSNEQSPEGAVLDLLADYLSHTLVLMIVWMKVAALTTVADDITPGLAALFALSSGGWYAALHNQALAGPDGARAGVLQRRMGSTALLRTALLGRHLMDTSLVIIALAIGMALGGYVLLGVFLATSAIRFTFIGARYLGLLLLARQARTKAKEEAFLG